MSISEKYDANEVTPWFFMSQHPVRDGMYQIRSKATKNVFDGWFENGRWNLVFGFEMSPLRLALNQYEWRGLNAPPKVVSVWDENGEISFP